MSEIAVEIRDLVKRFDPAAPLALDHISATIQTGRITGLVGPDGAGKTTLIRLMSGILLPSGGAIKVFGHDSVKDAGVMQKDISYMPQRFGLYEDLTVQENLNLYSDLHNVTGQKRKAAFERLLEFTSLTRFTDRLAGKLSGGMKQKLGLACSLVEKPRLLLLDEPGVGVDPISRRELWQLVKNLVDENMAVIWSTAYLDEAARCDSVLLLNGGKLLFDGDPGEFTRRIEGRTFEIRNVQGSKRGILADVLESKIVIDGVVQGPNIRVVAKSGIGAQDLSKIPGLSQAEVVPVPSRFEDGFMDILGGVAFGHSKLAEQMRPKGEGMAHEEPGKRPIAVEAVHLFKKFGDFTAANDINLSIPAGEMFGLLGPNGAGKSTTFKMLCGLLNPTSGDAKVAGVNFQLAASKARSRLGYMSQKFSLYGNLNVLQNLRFFSGAYGLYGSRRNEAVDRVIEVFALTPYLKTASSEIPLGFKQRLALACSVMHEPDVLFLDEPTSGVDPLTRREFWNHINGMVERGVTVMVTTHFMEEAEYCDRIALVYAGQMIAKGTPADLRVQAKTAENPNPTMEDAFIALIEAFDRERKENAA